MEKERSNLIIEFINLFTRSWGACLTFIGVGLIGKFGLYFRGGRKETAWQLLGSTLVACFVGYLASIYCMYHYPSSPNGYSKEGAFIVPIATLLSDRIMLFIVNINWNILLEFVLEKVKRNKTKN